MSADRTATSRPSTAPNPARHYLQSVVQPSPTPVRFAGPDKPTSQRPASNDTLPSMTYGIESHPAR